MKALAIAGANLRRTLRERTSVFFLFLFPMLLILVLGVAFGGTADPRVGVVAGQGPLARTMVDRLRAADGIDARTFTSETAAVAAVERGELEAVVVVPADYDAVVTGGGQAVLRYVVRPGLQGQQVGSIVTSVVDREAGRLRAARFAQMQTGLPFAEGLARADALAAQIPAISVASRTTGTARTTATTGRFDVMASSELLLFLFLTAMTSSAALIETRRLGVSRRMYATPTPPGTIVLGEALGRFTIAAVQGAFIMIGSALIFGVSWGDPLAAVALTTSFALVATGAGLLLGAAARTTQQATAIGLLLGLGLAALGGTMLPLEFFSSGMRTVAHFTPHAWAVDGFTKLLAHNAGVVGILPQLGVLLAIAAALLGLASWRLHRAIIH